MIENVRSLLNLGGHKAPTSDRPILSSANIVPVPSRRGFLFGAGAFLAAPAIVRVSALMPISVLDGDQSVTRGWMVIDRLTSEQHFLGDFDTANLMVHAKIRIALASNSWRLIYGTAGQ